MSSHCTRKTERVHPPNDHPLITTFILWFYSLVNTRIFDFIKVKCLVLFHSVSLEMFTQKKEVS